MYTYKIPSCGWIPPPELGCDTLPPDEAACQKMQTTYQLLAKNAIQAWKEESSKKGIEDTRLWIAVCGGPGAGKTTLGTSVAALINEELSSESSTARAVCVSMDGYHYTRAKLKELGLDIKRRGAPWTFDAERMANDLERAKQGAEHLPLFLPGYSRELSDPIERQASLEKHHEIILVEGNYVMLGKLWEECQQQTDNNCGIQLPYDYDGPRSIHDEVKRWKPVTDCFDYTWFVNPCDGYDEQRRRLIHRAIRTWNSQKSQEWGGGTTLEAAKRRVDYNDSKNALLVECCRKYANLVVASL